MGEKGGYIYVFKAQIFFHDSECNSKRRPQNQRPEWIVYYTGQLHFKVNDFHLYV